MKRRICFLAHNVRSLWNVGSFFRTADAMNIEKIYLTGYTGHPPRKEITKTALGAEETVEWEHAVEPLSILQSLKRDGWELVALELTPKSKDIHAFKPSKKECLIVGHELTGGAEDVLAICAQNVPISMP